MKHGGPRTRVHHRLVGHHQAPLVERALTISSVTRNVDAALGIALHIGPPGKVRTGPPGLRPVERLLRTHHGFVGGAGIARHADRADRGRERHRARSGRHHVVADRGEETLGGDRHLVAGAVLQDHAELVAGEPRQDIAAAQPGPDAPGDLHDHFIGHIEAEGID